MSRMKKDSELPFMLLSLITVRHGRQWRNDQVINETGHLVNV